MKEFFKCQECVDLLTDYLEGNLEPQVRNKLDDHLAACAPCINFVRSFEKSTTMLHLLKEQRVDVPADVQTRLKSFLREEIVSLNTERKKN